MGPRLAQACNGLMSLCRPVAVTSLYYPEAAEIPCPASLVSVNDNNNNNFNDN